MSNPSFWLGLLLMCALVMLKDVLLCGYWKTFSPTNMDILHTVSVSPFVRQCFFAYFIHSIDGILQREVEDAEEIWQQEQDQHPTLSGFLFSDRFITRYVGNSTSSRGAPSPFPAPAPELRALKKNVSPRNAAVTAPSSSSPQTSKPKGPKTMQQNFFPTGAEYEMTQQNNK